MRKLSQKIVEIGVKLWDRNSGSRLYVICVISAEIVAGISAEILFMLLFEGIDDDERHAFIGTLKKLLRNTKIHDF